MKIVNNLVLLSYVNSFKIKSIDTEYFNENKTFILMNAVKPSYIFSYWKPWNENANAIDSYLEYAKDVTLASYTAKIIGKYIQEASSNHLDQINIIGQKINNNFININEKLSEIKDGIVFLNRNLEHLIAQQKITNEHLNNISDLLTISNEEKERLRHIQLGVKFLSASFQNQKFYQDALNEFQIANDIMKHDFFVLNNIGFIYLNAPQYINIEKAAWYFEEAARYSSIETNGKKIKVYHDALSGRIKLSEMYGNIDHFDSRENINLYLKALQGDASAIKIIENRKIEEQIEHDYIDIITSEYIGQQAHCFYILGNFGKALELQDESVRIYKSAKNYFFLSKYLFRMNKEKEACQALKTAIEIDANIMNALFRDIDIISQDKTLKLIEEINDNTNKKLHELLQEMRKIHTEKMKEVLKNLSGLRKNDYETVDFTIKLNFIKMGEKAIKIEGEKFKSEIEKKKKRKVAEQKRLQKEKAKVKVKKELEIQEENYNRLKEINNKQFFFFSIFTIPIAITILIFGSIQVNIFSGIILLLLVLISSLFLFLTTKEEIDKSESENKPIRNIIILAIGWVFILGVILQKQSILVMESPILRYLIIFIFSLFFLISSIKKRFE